MNQSSHIQTNSLKWPAWEATYFPNNFKNTLFQLALKDYSLNILTIVSSFQIGKIPGKNQSYLKQVGIESIN